MDRLFIYIKGASKSELLNLNAVASATRSQAVHQITGTLIADRWYVTVRTVDGKEQRYGGKSADVIWDILQDGAFGFDLEAE